MGAMGKSAQFLLHTWLPDAMEGPTPVSALIHAATMVTAGVFMVARLSPIFELAPDALKFVTLIGAMTAFFAATVGLVQNDIKRVIAYSTCSQLGYMFVACGVGAYGAGIFHLFTHAFFKALLFLGAGSVIHAMHHEQDMRDMGGLRKKIPLTFAAMVVGTLALTGVGSRISRALPASIRRTRSSKRPMPRDTPYNYAFWTLVIAALMTSFYSWRLMFMTFYGETRADHHTFDHAHESPPTMLVPLRFWRSARSLAGVALRRLLHRPRRSGVLGRRRSSADEHNHILHEMHDVPDWVSYSPFVAMLAGFAIAWVYYIGAPWLPGRDGASVQAALPVPAQQMVLRRALRLPLRAPGIRARPPSLEGRRRRHHRRGHRRHGSGRRPRHRPRRQTADRLRLSLRLRDADRRGRAADLAHLQRALRRGDQMSNILSVTTFLPLVGALLIAIAAMRKQRATPAGSRSGRRSSRSPCRC